MGFVSIKSEKQATNATKTFDDKKVGYCYMLHTVLLVLILLLIITIIWYHYLKYRSKQKGTNKVTI